MKILVILFAVLFVAPSNVNAGKTDVIDYYQQRYPLNDANEKLVDNHGDGNSNLYGARNFRVVLKGVVYRGGANNSYNKFGKRSNTNPLPSKGLENLCKEGFTDAVYLYEKHFSSAPHEIDCKSVRGQSHLHYFQISPISDGQIKKIFSMVQQALDTQSKGPIYLHCWNGWHTSGLISALLLKQYCDVSSEQAVNYWNKNTDGNNGSDYGGFRTKIRNFQKLSEYSISPELKRKICPSL